MFVNSKKTGNLALQLISGNKNIDIFLSLSFSNVRVAIIAGTVHPKLISMGKNAFPDSPNIFINLFSKTEDLAMYPQLSKNVKHINIDNISGKNEIIMETAFIMLSSINDLIIGGEFNNRFSIIGTNLFDIKLDNTSDAGPPTQEKVILNIK